MFFAVSFALKPGYLAYLHMPYTYVDSVMVDPKACARCKRVDWKDVIRSVKTKKREYTPAELDQLLLQNDLAADDCCDPKCIDPKYHAALTKKMCKICGAEDNRVSGKKLCIPLPFEGNKVKVHFVDIRHHDTRTDIYPVYADVIVRFPGQ